MQRCEFCGWELPIDAHFCSNCGHVLANRMQAATRVTRPPEQDLRGPDTPPVISSPSHPVIGNAWVNQEDINAPTLRNATGWEMAQNPPPYPERQTGEQRAVLPDMLVPGVLLGQAQIPPAGQVPLVPGTPQIGGVPTVQGAPSMPGNPPPSVAQGFAHAAAPSMSPRAPTWERQVPRHPPAHHPQPEPHQHLHTAQVHAHRFRFPRPHLHGSAAGASTKVAVGVTTKWLIVALVAVVVAAATTGTVLVLGASPGLSLLSGSSSVASGDTLHLHGKGFLPGGSVALTLDHGLPVSVAGQRVPRTVAQGAGGSANFAGSSFMLLAGQLQQQSISVSVTGTFDADVAVLPGWSPGMHTIHATESLGSRSADLQFNIRSTPARLVVAPSALNFPQLQVGSKAVQSIEIGNSGQARLDWTAATDGSKWLKLQEAAGAIEYRSSDQFIEVIADASQLKVGTYHATISIHSNGGDAQILVNLNVVPKNQKPEAQLTVIPQSLDFGQLSANQQVTRSLSISNLGLLPLTWQANTGGTTWLFLNTSNGTVQPGTAPQTIQVTVNTTGLAGGSYSGTININSNGGTSQVTVTFIVRAGGPPTPSPTPPPATLIGSPNSFNVPGDPNCTYNASTGWSCTASLSSPATAQSNINWSASSSGVPGVTFNPQTGTLVPGQATPVTISIPNTACPASATFAFSGQANSVDVVWSCAALTLSVSKASFNANTGCQFNNGWTCTEILSTGSNAQGNLNWTASSSGIAGIAISPQSGVLSPGQATSVGITVPNTACPASANLTFSGQGAASVTVPWSCGAPALAVSPTSFNIPAQSCSYTAGQGWTCTATISLGSPGDPSVNWSVSGGISGTTFSPPGGTVSAGSPVTVTITVPDAVCPTQANITFSGQGTNPVTVPWSCAAPTLTASATPSNCPQNSDGSYTCTDTVAESANSQGSLIWSASSSSNLPGVTFSPQNGTLSPNGSTVVTISVPANDCMDGSFNYSEQGTSNTAMVTWTCMKSTPVLTVNPTSFNSNNCSNNGTTWICTATLTSNGTLSWYASSNDPSAIGFSPASGTVSPGSPASVQIDIPYSCPSSASLSFVGQGANTVNVTWNC